MELACHPQTGFVAGPSSSLHAVLQLAASPVEDVMTLSNEYVLAMAECLLKGGDDPDTPAGRRLVCQCTRLKFWFGVGQVEAGQIWQD